MFLQVLCVLDLRRMGLNIMYKDKNSSVLFDEIKEENKNDIYNLSKNIDDNLSIEDVKDKLDYNELHQEIDNNMHSTKLDMLVQLHNFNSDLFKRTIKISDEKHSILKKMLGWLVFVLVIISISIFYISFRHFNSTDSEYINNYFVAMIPLLTAFVVNIFSILKVVSIYLSEDKTTDLLTIISQGTIDAIRESKK